MRRLKKTNELTPKSKNKFLYLSYGLLGTRLGGLFPHFESLKSDLAKSNIPVSYKAYVSQLFLSVIITSVSMFATLLALSRFFSTLTLRFVPPIFVNPLVIGILSLGAGGFAFVILYRRPAMKVGSRRNVIERLLPMTASYASVLACTGVAPERIIRSLATANPKLILADEFKMLQGKVDIFGMDVLSAIDSEVARSPSPTYSNFLKGFGATIRTGGNVKNYFLTSTTQLLRHRSIVISSFITTLSLLAETYVLMFTAFPLMLVVMLSIMVVIGGSIGGFSILTMMYLLTFAIIPLLAIVFIVILDTMQPKG